MAQDKTKGETPPEAPAPQTIETIEFFGPGKEVTIRRITDEDWNRLGYEGLESTDWRKENDWRVPMDHFKGKIPEMREFFGNQPDFRIIQVEVPVED